MADNVDALLEFADARQRAFQKEQMRAIESALP
jgi:hypothetical protein